jgi:hypothetical protein
MMGLVVVQILLSAGHDATQQAWQDDRVSMMLGDLAGQLETDLSVGIDPTTNGQAQRALSDVYAQHAILYRIALVNTEGRVVADSDRGNIGMYVPKHLIAAALSLSAATPMREDSHRAGQTWATDRRVHGVSVRNAFGATVGYVLVGLPALDTAAGLRWRVLAIWCVTAVGVFCTAWVLALLVLRRERQREEGALSMAYDRACSVAHARLVRLEAALVDLRHYADTP